MSKIAVSILSSSYDTEETINRINKLNVKYFHIDVMDGLFVKNEVNPFEYVNLCTKPLNVHLMVVDPFKYITEYASLNITDTIIFQVEIDENIGELIDYIHSFNIKAGLAIKPATDITDISSYLDKIDEVLVMSVEPGAGGQAFMDSSYEKIEMLKKIRETRKLKFKIGVDGGVNDTNYNKLKDVDIIAVGSYICKSEDYQKQVDKLNL